MSCTKGARYRQTQTRQLLLETGLVEAFHEPAAIVTENSWLDDHHIGNARGNQFHKNCKSVNLVVDDLEQVLAITILQHGLSQLFHLLRRDPAPAVGNFFQASNLEALPTLKRGNELPRLRRLSWVPVSSQSITAAHDFHIELALLQIERVYVGDFEFTTWAGLDVRSNVAHLVVVEVQAGDRIVAQRLFGLFFDAQCALLTVELDHAIAFGVMHVVGKHTGTGTAFGRALEQTLKAWP